MSATLKVADLFCGAGGTTTGAMQAIHELGRDVEFVAVNHWPVAIATHEANHPNVRHYCKDLDTANPCEIVPEGHLDLLLASPECRFHSPAQGGRPLDEQNRASALHVIRWAERLYIRRIVVENVPRFVKWGPLDRRGRPIKSREGELFRAWVAMLEAFGYRVEWRVLNAADYGTPQTRRRLFVQARRDGRRIVWPDRTHAQRGHERTLQGQLVTWEAARSAIRFDKYRHLAKPVEEKDLSPKTLARIAEGVKRFCRGVDVEPFLVMLRRHADANSIEEPMPTVTTSGNHHVLIEPFLVAHFGERDGQKPRVHSVDDTLPTVMANSRSGHVIEPFILSQNADQLVRSVEDPLPTIVASRPHAHLIEPYIEPYLVRSNRGPDWGDVVRDLEATLPTITQKNGVGLVEPQIEGGRLVLLHRMLQPEELALGQDFEGYAFTGTREEQTKQIGNAVPIKLARAMTAAAFYDLAPAVIVEDIA